MKKLNIFFSYTLLIFALNVSFAAEKTTQPLNGIVAVVNHDIITQGQLDQSIDLIKKQFTAQHQPLPSEEELRKKILDQLISQRLQMQTAKAKNITISDEQVDEAINRVAKQHNATLLELKQGVEHEGLKFPEYRERIRNELTMQTIQMQALRSKEINVSKQEVNEFIKKAKPNNAPKYHLQGILISVAKDATSTDVEKAKQKAEGILTRVKGGADFAQTAAAESNGPHAFEGGDLGWHTLSAADPFFAAQIVAAKPDDIVGPMQTPEGFYIIKVLEIQADPMPPADQLAIQAKEILYQRKYMEAVEEWSKTLRERAYVKVMV